MIKKVNKTEEGFIKIPTDFKSLHDLKDLVNNYDLVSRLSNLLNGYQKAHIDSYLMTMDEVLEYLSEKEHKKYKVMIAGSQINEVYVSDKKRQKELAPILLLALSKKRDYNYKLNQYELSFSSGYKEEPIFIVNTLKKEINVIYWYSKLSFYNKPHKYGKIEYEINEEKILSVKVHFSFTDYQQVGGAKIWCGTGHTYFRGGDQVPYQREGYEVYEFDTKTNQYLGYEGTVVITPERKWHKEKNPYV